jgi:hypothetical protein
MSSLVVRLAVARLLLDFGMPRPASQDRARIVFDCRMVNNPAMMIDGFCTGEMDYKLPPNRS